MTKCFIWKTSAIIVLDATASQVVTYNDMLHTEYCNNFEVQHGLLRSESKKILKKVQQCLTNSDKNPPPSSQGARAGRGFYKLHQEVWHHQGGLGNSLDHPQCSDKSQNQGFFGKIIFLILGDSRRILLDKMLRSKVGCPPNYFF